MEPGPSGSSGSGGGSYAGGGGISSMPERTVQQLIVAPIPGPSTRPYLAQPVQMPAHFLVPPEQLLPHQVKSGIDIGNLFKLLNALQNRIALACGQHQYLRDPENQPRPPQDGGYKPLTPQAAVRDIRSLCKQQRNLMEKLRRWNCTNDGKCYDLVMKDTFSGICSNCEPFAASRIRMKRVSKTLRKQEAKTRRRSLKKLTSAKTKQRLIAKRKIAVTAPVPGPSSRVIPGPSSRVLPGPSSRVLPGPSSRAFSVPSYYLLPGPSSRLLPPPPVFRVPTSPPVKKRRKKSYTLDPDPPHPETYLTQENFLSELGLVTPEVYLKAQAESRRTERRRRTTANPKYKSKDDPNDAGRSKRSRRSDPSSLEPPPAPNSLSLTGVERRKAKQKRYECTVCEKKDVTVTCTRCMSGFHPECIRVTATHAPPPETVTVCPNCVPCNPHIRSSDCILVSRRMSRPSIMGLKSDVEELKPNGSPKHSQASRNYKATSRRRATARNYSKAARRNAAAKAKQQKQKTKAVVICKPTPVIPVRKTGGQSSKKCYAKRTLNHSLAVAAAAAVPAYCSTSTTSSVEDEDDEDDDDDESEEIEEAKDEMVEKEPVKARSSQPAQRKRKLVASSLATFSRVKQQQSTPASGERKALFAKRENSTAAQQQTNSKAAKESTFAKKSVMSMKSTNLVSKKLSSQSSIEKDELNVGGQKSVPSHVTQQPGEIKTAQQNLPVNHTKVDINRPKKTIGKTEKAEENATPAVSENDGQTPTTSKAVIAKKDSKVQQVKKVTVTKSPGQVGPFCMKRTMMAMSAAAGLVFSGSGLKLGNVQNNASSQSSSLSNSPTPVSVPQKSIEQSHIAPKPNVASSAVPSTSTTSTPVSVQSVSKAAMDAKLKYVAQKLTKSPMAAQLADIVNYNGKCANDIKKSSQTGASPPSASEVASKSLPKPTQAVVSTLETTTNTANSFEKTEKSKSTETTAQNKPKTLVTFSSTSTSQTSQSNMNTKSTDNASKTSVNLKTNAVQAQRLIPEPAAIVSQLANTIKNKLGEKGLNKISPVAAETLAKHVQSAIPSTSCSSSGLSASGSDDISITKFAVLPTETKGKTVKISPKSPTTFSHYASLKYDSDEETKRIQTTPPDTKLNYSNKKSTKKPAIIKSVKNSPSQTVPQQQQIQPPFEDHEPPKKQMKIVDTKEEKVLNRTSSSTTPPAKVKAKRTPKPVPKMDPAVEQSVMETIERVVYESGAGLYVDDEDEIDDAYSLAIAMRKKNQHQPRPRLTYDDDVLSKIVGNPYTKLLSKSCQLPDEIDFSYKKISHDHHHHHERSERAGSPASNSSTIGSSRSLRDLESDSSDLLSIPDTPVVPYLDLKRLELPGPKIDLSPLERLEMRRKNLAAGIPFKKGRGGGKGRGGRY